MRYCSAHPDPAEQAPLVARSVTPPSPSGRGGTTLLRQRAPRSCTVFVMTPPNEHTSEGGRDDRGVPYHAESTLSSAQVLKCVSSSPGQPPGTRTSPSHRPARSRVNGHPKRRARGVESHRLARSAAPPSARETFLNHTTPGAVECTELPRRPRGSRLGGSGVNSFNHKTPSQLPCPPTSRHPPRRYAQKSFRQRETSRPLRRRRPLEALALPLPRNQRPHHCLPVEPPPHRARSVPG